MLSTMKLVQTIQNNRVEKLVNICSKLESTRLRISPASNALGIRLVRTLLAKWTDEATRWTTQRRNGFRRTSAHGSELPAAGRTAQVPLVGSTPPTPVNNTVIQAQRSLPGRGPISDW